MIRFAPLILVVVAALPLGGCVAQAALAAAEMAQYLPPPDRPSNAHLKPAATAACTARAAQHGSVFVLDVEQRRADRLVVWGSVTDAQLRRRTFECEYSTAILAFRLREIGAAR